MTALGPERRKSRRIPVLVRVDCETPQNCFFGNCENISETGMLIACRQNVDVSQHVLLRFVLPGVLEGKMIRTQGVIVRVHAGEYMAVEFQDMLPMFREALQRYVERTVSEATEPKSTPE